MPRYCIIVLFLVTACGGKILVTNADDAGAEPPPQVADGPPAFAPPPEPAPQEPTPPRAPITIPDACANFCQRNDKCGKQTVTCVADCLATASDHCNGADWITCTGGTPGDRCLLPPACEQSYCAWARCAGRVLPDYC